MVVETRTISMSRSTAIGRGWRNCRLIRRAKQARRMPRRTVIVVLCRLRSNSMNGQGTAEKRIV